MQGFFSKKEVESVSRLDGKVHSCISCGLHKNSTHPKMKPYGEFKKGIMVIGNFPSLMDDANNQPFSDKTGRFLKKIFRKAGIDLETDCRLINALSCVPHQDKNPDGFNIACCRRIVMKHIANDMPKVIIALGIESVESLIGHRWKKSLEDIGKWRGWTIPDQDLKAWVCPVYNPSFVMGSEQKEVETVFTSDVEKALSMVKVPFLKAKKCNIEIIDDLRPLKEISRTAIASIDYETTGLKPHKQGHRIVCASVSTSDDAAMVFMMPEEGRKRKLWNELLASTYIGKSAQNMKFEAAWSQVYLKQTVNHWVWDTMIASHILDNRPGITGLKFQTFVQFGVVDYSSEIDPFLRSFDDKDGNSFNRILELCKTREGREKLMIYCGYDTIYEYRLMELQTKQIDYPFLPF